MSENHPFEDGYSLYEVTVEATVLVLAKSENDAIQVAEYEADYKEVAEFSARKLKLEDPKVNKVYASDDSLPWGGSGCGDITIAELAEWVRERTAETQAKEEFERQQTKLSWDNLDEGD